MLYGLIPKLVSSMGLPQGADMRCSLWMPDGKEFIRQATNYWPDNVPPGGAGRLHISQGLVGRAFRRRTAEIYLVRAGASPEAYRAELVRELGFTAEEATRVNLNQKSRLAVPVVRESDVCGVFYCDSSTVGLFAGDNFDQTWLDRVTRILSLFEPLFEEIANEC